MFNQNWFDEKNYTMFIDETECRAYYDTNTRNIYVVTEHHDGSKRRVQFPFRSSLITCRYRTSRRRI